MGASAQTLLLQVLSGALTLALTGRCDQDVLRLLLAVPGDAQARLVTEELCGLPGASVYSLLVSLSRHLDLRTFLYQVRRRLAWPVGRPGAAPGGGDEARRGRERAGPRRSGDALRGGAASVIPCGVFPSRRWCRRKPGARSAPCWASSPASAACSPEPAASWRTCPRSSAPRTSPPCWPCPPSSRCVCVRGSGKLSATLGLRAFSAGISPADSNPPPETETAD